MYAIPATSSGEPTDASLVNAVLTGERHAFEQLMRRYNRRLYRVARSVLKHDADAEDALQDAYLQAFRALPSFRGDAALSTWLTRIVLNTALASQRKARRMAEVIELGGEEPLMADSTLEQQSEAPEQAAVRTEARRLLEAKVDGLPQTFRTVFVLRALEEFSVEETAATLGIPEATVRSRYFRARSLLRESLAREIDFALEDAFAFDGARCDRIVRSVLDQLPPAAGD